MCDTKGCGKEEKGCGAEEKRGAEQRKCTLGPPYIRTVKTLSGKRH